MKSESERVSLHNTASIFTSRKRKRKRKRTEEKREVMMILHETHLLEFFVWAADKVRKGGRTPADAESSRIHVLQC